MMIAVAVVAQAYNVDYTQALHWEGVVFTPGLSNHVGYEGQWAVVSDFIHGLQVVDTSDLNAPEVVSTVPEIEYPTAVDIAGDYAVVSDFGFGLYVVNIADLENPMIVDSEPLPFGASGVTVTDDTVLAAGSLEGVFSFTMDLYGELEPVGALDTPGEALDIEPGAPGVAYLADEGGGILRLDVSDPANMSITHTAATPGDARSVSFHEGTVYGIMRTGHLVSYAENNLAAQDTMYLVPDGHEVDVHDDVAVVGSDGGVLVVDVSDPFNMAYGGHVMESSEVRAVDREDGVTAIANWAGQFIIMKGDLFPVTPIASIGTVGACRDVKVRNDIAYVADGAGTLSIWDVSTPESAFEISSLPLSQPPALMAMEEPYVVTISPALEDTSQASLANISNPGDPFIESTVGIPGQVGGLVLRDGLLYAAAGDNGLVIADCSDPEDILITSETPTPGNAIDLCVYGSIAVVADGPGGGCVLDISDPANPNILGSIPTEDDCVAIAQRGRHVYLGISGGKFRSIDSGDSWFDGRSGETLDELNLPGTPTALRVMGSYACVTLGSDGFALINVADGSNLAIAGGAETLHEALDISMAGDGFFVADTDSGLQIFPGQLGLTGADEWAAPTGLKLRTYPNPVFSSAHIAFTLPRAGFVSGAIYDLRGRLIRNFGENRFSEGEHSLFWNGLDAKGQPVSSGIYLIRVDTEQGRASGKLLFLR